MQRRVLFAAVAFLLFGHIYSAVITGSDTTQSPELEQTQSAATSHELKDEVEAQGQATTRDIPAATPAPCHHTDNKLKVDSSNPTLGDMPIFQDSNVDIINRNHVPLRNCEEILDYGSFNKSGLYVVQPGMGGEFVVYCDMTLLGGGWTIIQRRLNSKLSFNRNYGSYKNGFGDFTENFWLGLDKISRLTQSADEDAPMEVYFGVEAFFDSSSFARYSQFSVGPEESGYKLKIGGFNTSSNARDSISFNNGQKFSTPDKDQDTQKSYHCSRSLNFDGYNGGWWFRDCVYTNLNGRYYEDGPNRNAIDGISWRTWLGSRYSLKSTVIAVRPAH